MATVTIDKGYFETLLRKAQYHTTGIDDFTTPVSLPVVSIPQVDHQNLLDSAQNYAKLRAALLQGGIAPETLEVLIKGPSQSSADLTWAEPRQTTPLSKTSKNRWDTLERNMRPSCLSLHQSQPRKPTLAPTPRFSRMGLEDTSSFFAGEPEPSDMEDFDETETATGFGAVQKAYFRGPNHDRRSIILSNVAPTTSPKDVVAAIRGGQLLDMYFRPGRDFSINIAFVEGTAAQQFMEWVKRNDLYINGRRIEVTWNDRQYTLQGHIASRIYNNKATRNLLLSHVSPQITAKKIRDDLDHIHNLTVVDISFDLAKAYVSLNSVNAACFARQCLMSRAQYKGGTKITYYADECGQPLPSGKNKPSQPKAPVMKPSKTGLNKFQALQLTSDGSDGSSDDDSELTNTPTETNGVRI